jgi:hypothetical protein
LLEDEKGEEEEEQEKHEVWKKNLSNRRETAGVEQPEKD